ncbi:MAG: hypothetical protein DMD72_12880 [Gemmatimonadetes bacterium]|nr:MAG: hypothetical protein DMD72_12880 [Gemmatimonadota bacterium]
MIPSLVGVYPGDDFYLNAAAFQQFGIIVNADCQGNNNLIYAFGKVLTALGSPKPYNFSCTDNPQAADFILTPTDTAFVDNLIRQMNAHIAATATAHGWSYFDLNVALAPIVVAKTHFSLTNFLSCTRPFGQYISLDGIHPTADGQQTIANAAADALNSTYGFAIPKVDIPALTPTQLCP